MEPLDAIREALEREPGVAFATVFGSRARGTARPDSDWDVGVYLADSLDPRERLDWRLRLISSLEPRFSVDVVMLNDAPPLLAHRALQGTPLLVRDRVAWVRHFVRTLALAGDDRIHARVHADARSRRLKEGRFGRP